jgi:GT2 family glycosyltransferase/predicted O-methyltransferase YrrM
VSVVLLTNGKPHLLPEVLGSVFGQTHRPVEVVVVLNGVLPAVEAALKEFPDARVLRNDRDVGFAAGMNQGVRAATGRYVYLTANDTVLAPDYLAELVRAAEATPGWGIAGGVWHDYSGARAVYAAGGAAWFGFGLRTAVHTAVPDAERPYAVDWVSGAGLFAPRTTWEALGGYRDEFFAHAEDVELCLRARRAGGYVRIVPTARLYHHEHPNGLGRNQRIEFHKLKNYLAVNALHGPLLALPWVAAKFALYTAPRVAWHLRSPRFLARSLWGSWVRLPRWLVERIFPPPERNTMTARVTVPLWVRLCQTLSGVWCYGPGTFRLAREAIVRRDAAQRTWELMAMIDEVRRLEPRVVVEIGSRGGGTIYCWAQASPTDATLVSIDLPGGPFGGGYSEEHVAAMQASLRPGQSLKCLRADWHAPETRAALVEHLAGRPVDFLFIDGDHSYAGVKQDYEMYAPLVRKGGLIGFHDIIPHPEQPEIEVPHFWGELKQTSRMKELVAPDQSRAYGMGIGVVIKES